MKHLALTPSREEPPTRDSDKLPPSLPDAKETRVHPTNSGGENAKLLFVGTATVILYVSRQIDLTSFQFHTFERSALQRYSLSLVIVFGMLMLLSVLTNLQRMGRRENHDGSRKL